MFGVLLVLVAGCGVLRSHPSAAEWSEVASEHFVMWTDGDLGHARETLAELEHTRSIVLGVAFPTLSSHRKTLVVAFRDRNEVAHYLPPIAAPDVATALAMHGTPLLEPVIVMAADADEVNQRILTHELTHAISFEFIHRQPGWFAEGLASFFETVALDPASADVAVGEPNLERVPWLRRGDREAVADVFACAELGCYSSGFYATSWALFAFLMNQHPAELARYEQALVAAAHPPAWSDVVPELPTAELDRQLGLWLIRGQHTVWRYKLRLQPWPTTTRKLPEADVHAIEAMILVRRHPDESRTELATALRLDPTNLVANLVVAERDHGLSLAVARALVAAHGDDWRAWLRLGVALEAAHDPEARATFVRICELLAKDPHADPPQGLTCSTVAAP